MPQPTPQYEQTVRTWVRPSGAVLARAGCGCCAVTGGPSVGVLGVWCSVVITAAGGC